MENMATRDAYGQALAELGQAHADVMVLDADLSGSTKTSTFAKKFPNRFFNLGVAEQNMIGWAAGLAATGKVPFASTFAVFATGRAFDQLRNSVAYPALNVKIAATHAGLSVGPDGGSHQAIEDIALARILPNFTVVVPADGPQAAEATRAAYAQRGPVYLRLGRPKVQTVTQGHPFVLGKAQMLRTGSDATIIACGTLVQEALSAADSLAKENISLRVLNVHTIKPLDENAILAAARETGAVLSAEEHTILGGLGSAVAELFAEAGLGVPFKRLGVRDQFGESGEPGELFKKHGLDAASLAAAVRELLKKKK
ncbi:MAG: transketolase family protein [Candidatus Firestonebacteria bacterium]|nr:transketolase family protein [Candidatus Firestonebacteria bacterium]